MLHVDQRSSLATMVQLDDFDQDYISYELTNDLSSIDLKEIPQLDNEDFYVKHVKGSTNQVVPEMDVDHTSSLPHSKNEAVFVVPEHSPLRDTHSSKVHTNDSYTMFPDLCYSSYSKFEKCHKSKLTDSESQHSQTNPLVANLHPSNANGLYSDPGGQLVPVFEPLPDNC